MIHWLKADRKLTHLFKWKQCTLHLFTEISLWVFYLNVRNPEPSLEYSYMVNLYCILLGRSSEFLTATVTVSGKKLLPGRMDFWRVVTGPSFQWWRKWSREIIWSLRIVFLSRVTKMVYLVIYLLSLSGGRWISLI